MKRSTPDDELERLRKHPAAQELLQRLQKQAPERTAQFLAELAAVAEEEKSDVN